MEQGGGLLSVEALDERGDYRNFLNLQAAVVSPTGKRETVTLQQTGPGHYEARFPTREVGAYLLNLMNFENGQLQGAQTVGANINYSPEFNASEPNLNLLRRIAESGGGKLLNPASPTDNPFLHDRRKTYQARDLWEWLLRLAIVLFVLDVGVRRIQLDRAEWARAWAALRRRVFFWTGAPRPAEAAVSLAALLARRNEVRAAQTQATAKTRPDGLRLGFPQSVASAQIAPTSAGEPVTARSDTDQSAPPAAPPVSTASRLLEAKRRAQPRRKS